MKGGGHPARRGFTLLEIVLAIAIMGLIATALIGGATSMLSTKPTSPDAVFWSAVFQARKKALEASADVQLSYDPKAQAFVVNDGTATKTIPIPKAIADLTVAFIPAQDDQSMALLGGLQVATDSLPFVTFYHDGTCSPFRVQIHNQLAAHILKIDPWTCAQVLAPPDPNAPHGP